MSSLGELYFQLGLDDKKFNDAIEAAKQKVKELGADVEIGVKLDLEGLKKEIQNAAKAAGGDSLEIGAKVNTSGLENLYSMLESSKKEAKELEEAIAKTTAASVKVQKQAELDGVRRRIADQEAKILAKGGSLDASKATIVKVELDEESINQVKARLTQLEHPITPKVSIEYDQEKFRAVATTLENYTKRLNELGTVRLGIDDSFIRTGVGQDKKGLNGWLSNISDYLLGDDTGDAGKSIKSIQKVLDNYTFKVKAEVDAQKLVASISGAVKKVPVDINVDIEAVKKKLKQLGVPLNFNMTQAIADAKTKLKDQEFKAKLNLVIDKAKVSKAIKEAFAKKGLEYQATPSDVRNARILEIQQRMEHRQKKFTGQVDNSNKSMNRMLRTTKHVADWAGQLSNQFANLISVYSLERFIRSLYTIGGEFQKQQIALRTMIGDAEKGNVVFERMKDLAVKSPFTFSDLASYTKQMSAYGIEYEELYDTTKRLADISAGVGVDMGRLILAYGQVRSAEVLRGQELRQFTEAGIPLVAELAKRLSEVRGEAVKVGEVFEAISKRQVSFDMVKDVLFDMTDPGGRFFEMQEELAKSLAGQWSNLKDAWDIMIADIANSSNNILSKAAGFFSDILRSWREWIPALTAIAGAIGVVTSAIRVATTATTIFNAVSNANPWMKLASIILGAAGAIGGWVLGTETAGKNTNQLNAELDEEIQKWNENRANALRYIDTLKSANTSEERRILLYKELLDLYPEIFKNMKMEELMLMSSVDLKTKINKETTKQQLARIEKEIEDERLVVKYIKDSQKRKTARGSMVVRSLSDDEKAKLNAAESRIAELEERKVKLQRDIDREGLIKALTPDSDISKYIEVYRELGKAVKILRKGGILGEITNPKEGTSILEYYDQLNSALKEQNEIKEKFKPTTNEYKEADNLAKVYQNAIDAIGGVWKKSKKGGKSEAEKAAERDAKAYLDALKERLKEIGSQWSLFKELMDATGNRQLSLNLSGLSGTDFRNQLEHLRSEMTKELQKTGVNLSAADVFNMSFDELAKIVGDEEKLKRIKEIYDTYHNANRDLRMETIKDFAEIIKASRDFESKIAEIERKLQEDLSKLRLGAKEGGLDLNSDEYKRAEQKLREEAEKAKANERFEEFKASSDWVKVFDDLDRVATPTLDDMLDKMEAFIYQIEESPEAMKEMLKALGDVREKLSERNPFGAFARWLKEIRNIKAARWLLAGNDSYTFQQDLYGFKAGQKITPEILDNLEKGAVSDFNLALSGTSAAFENLKNVIEPVIDLFNHGVDSVSIFFSAIGGALSGALNMSNSFSSLMGLQIGSGENAKSLGSMLGIKNAGLWGAAAGAALGAISAISEAHDKKLDKAIRKSQLEVQKLGNEYKNLEHTIERQLGSQTASQSKVMINNLRSQRRELMEQYGLEDEKKKTDASKLEDYKRQIKEIDQQIKYFYEDLAKEQYDADIKDWAGQIASALVEAFASGEDAALAFDNTVGGILRNLATEAIRLQFIEPAMAGLRDFMFGNVGVFTDLSESGSDLSANEAIQLQGELDKLKGQIEKSNDYWDKINEAVGGIMDDTESAASGGLSKGVQSVTEDTANLLGSYLNSIRHDSSVQRTLVEQLVSVDVPKMSIIAQAQLQQLQQVAANTKRNADAADRIYELVNKVVDKGSNKIKV